MASAKTAPTLPSPASGGGTKTGGLRERKKQKTRESIQRTALRLFGKQGYEATTVEQIAAAAEISPSTFFNYFPAPLRKAGLPGDDRRADRRRR